MSSRVPRYRIQTVTEMTGVPASTLRAWERRYGVPSPERTSSAYRLYSDADLDVIKRMRDLCASGLAPSEAVQALRVEHAAEELREQPPQVTGVENAFEEATHRLMRAIEDYDMAAMRAEMARATYLGSCAAVFEGVFAPAMRAVGNLWHQGRITVAQEHLATEVLGGMVRDLLRHVQPEESSRMALLACATHEDHTLPLYGVAFRLAQWGYRTELMGANTPPDALAAAVVALSPDLVGLSFTVTPIQEVSQQLDAYAAAVQGRPWVVGGVGARAIQQELEKRGAVVAGPEVESVRAAVEQALSGAAPRRQHHGGVA